MKWAFLFPGQGAQHVGMGLELARRYESARRIFELADQVLGVSLSQICFSGPSQALNLTENTQPALVTVSIAAWTVLDDAGIEPSVVAGLSLGEYAALVASGSLEFAEAVRIVRNRGRYMQECVPEGVGGMAAIIGLDPPSVLDVCREVSSQSQWVEPANYNGPGQVVISGHAGAVNLARQKALEAGAKKAVALPVSAPFHSRLMDGAAERLRKDLEQADIRPGRVPLVANYNSRALTEPGEIIDALVEGVRHPVRWDECVAQIASMKPQRWAEVGPGKSLAGMVKRILPGTLVESAGAVEDLERLVEAYRRAC